jgi:site-specific DNA recombinase
MMVDGEITAADYREIKGRYEPEIRQLAQKLNDQIKAACELLRNLRLYYTPAALPVKQKLIGSMFPEKLVFEKTNYRTIKLHPTVALICRPGEGLGEKRKGLASKIRSQPYPVSPIGFEPMAH